MVHFQPANGMEPFICWEKRYFVLRILKYRPTCNLGNVENWDTVHSRLQYVPQNHPHTSLWYLVLRPGKLSDY